MTNNVVGLFMDAASRAPTVPALVSAHEGSITFAELRARVEDCASGMSRAGLRKGERAVFMMPMSIDLYVAVLGVLSLGGVATFVDPWVPIREIARLAAAARPAAFIGSPRAHFLRWLSPELRAVRITVVSGGRLGALVARHRLTAMRGEKNSTVDVDPDTTALITYTTGSSGRAKGVNRTHAILAAQHSVIREEFPAIPGDVDVTTFPVFALSNLAAGITTVIPQVNLRRVADADPRLIIRDIERFDVTTAAASPPFFDAMARHGGSDAS
jgi:acyl-coenzyme A synthetase/AMP-(fatty) acid ligase